MRTRVKICGITRLDDARAAVDAGADALGFVFWPDSPRCVSMAAATAIVRMLPPTMTPVGVFVNQPLDEIARVAATVGLQAVQLHGDEPAEQCASLPYPCLKAVAVSADTDAARVAAWPAFVLPLLDVHDPVRRGGTGRTVDWTVAARLARLRPVMLAGGLRPENVEDAIAQVAPYGVDVSSGVEERPGIKDPRLIRALAEAVARADARKER
jgi:phosphoribosylanthranilate isomerase